MNTKLKKLFKEYQSLTTPAERHRWLDEHRSDFYDYDININNIKNIPVSEILRGEA